MSELLVKSWVEDDIAVIQLDRPKANAITYEVACQLETCLEEIFSSQAKAIVATGNGNFFSGGLDLREVPEYSAKEQHDFLQVINRVITRLYCCPVPLIGAVNGHAIAAGFIFALTADYRIGPETDALFGLTEARVGIPFPAAAMEILKAELSPSDVRYSTLSALTYGPADALRRGVFDELAANADVLARGLEVARDHASMPADAYCRIKTQVRGEAMEKLHRLNQEESDPMLDAWISPDASSASSAVLDGH